VADEKEDKREDAARSDAEEKLDKLLSYQDKFGEVMDALCNRMDAMKDELEDLKKDRKDKDEAEDAKEDGEEDEGADEITEPGDPEPVAADKGRKDAKRKDAAKRDENNDKPEGEFEPKGDGEEDEDDKHADSDTARRIADVERRLSGVIRGRSDADTQAIADSQHEAARVFNAYGENVPQPIADEEPLSYRRRLANKLKARTVAFKDVNLQNVNDPASFELLTRQIFEQAYADASAPANLPAGHLRLVSKTSNGHTINTYVGDSSTWMDPIAGMVKNYVTKINQGTGG
jgi:hypothetical protein